MSSPLIWKLLRKHISVSQLTGFFLANLIGTLIVLLSIQFYQDILPIFTQGDSFLKKDFIIISKKVSTLGGFIGQKSTFSIKEINALEEQAFTRKIGSFTPSQYHVTAGLNLQNGMQFSTEMFFESVPDNFIDISLKQWDFKEFNSFIPIIIPRNYLNLYNFGFAPSRNLPKISEGLAELVPMNIVLHGNGKSRTFKGKIVGFSNRLNTILVPQSFMNWANRTFAPTKKVSPSRLILEVNNPTDTVITSYFKQHNYETEGNALDASKTTYFLRLIIGIVLITGIIISVLSLYILTLSIFLLLQKNHTKIEKLLLIGYGRTAIAFPYYTLIFIINSLTCIFSIASILYIREEYISLLQDIYPEIRHNFPCTIVIGIVASILLSSINCLCILKKIKAVGNYF